jgi:hypothetical protein
MQLEAGMRGILAQAFAKSITPQVHRYAFGH